MNPTLTLQEEEKEAQLPLLSFRLEGRCFAVNIRQVVDIVPCPAEIVPLPDAPHYVQGVINLRGNIIPLVPLRVLLGMETSQEEIAALSHMLEERKQDHLNWVKELEHCVECDTEFTLATDPHQCAFGKWYYSFQPNSLSLQHHLKKIEDPHNQLHLAAIEVQKCNKDCEHCGRQECAHRVLKRLKGELTPKLLELLDTAKDVLYDTLREMVIVLENETGGRLGFVVDEVLSVGALSPVEDGNALQQCVQSVYLEHVALTEAGETVLVLKDAALLQLLGS